MARKKGDKQGTLNRCGKCGGRFYAPGKFTLCPTCRMAKP